MKIKRLVATISAIAVLGTGGLHLMKKQEFTAIVTIPAFIIEATDGQISYCVPSGYVLNGTTCYKTEKIEKTNLEIYVEKIEDTFQKILKK